MSRPRVLLTLLLLAVPAAAQSTLCASLGTSGTSASGQRPSISDDGRYVAFENLVGGVVAGDTNGKWDIFVFDRVSGTTERVSLDNAGAQIAEHSEWPGISGDGRFVAFTSIAKNIMPGETNNYVDIFVRDRIAGTTTLASLPDGGGFPAGGGCARPVMNADGRYVAFESFATNLVTGDINSVDDVFVRDRVGGSTERVSQKADGTAGDGDSYMAHLSADGRWVVFTSKATTFEAAVSNGKAHIWRKDRLTGALVRVSVAADGGQVNNHCYNPRVSDDGRWVSFESSATNLVANDTSSTDVYVRDMLLGQTRRVTVDPLFAPGTFGGSNGWISGDGRFVAFESFSPNLVAGDITGFNDVFVRDLATNLTVRHSVSTAGVPGNGDSTGNLPYNGGVVLSRNGQWLGFSSFASNLAPGDTSTNFDVFVRGALPIGAATFVPVGPGLAGSAGPPALQVSGTLQGGSTVVFQVSNARVSSPLWLLTGFSALNAPFKGGTLVPSPDLVTALGTDAGGALLLAFPWPVGLPSGVGLWWQAWIADAAAAQGFAATNGIKGTLP